MAALFEDVRFALRLLARQPGFTSLAVLLLALGMGVNTAIFSIVDSVLLRPLPYKDPSKLYYLWTRNLQKNRPQASLSAPEFREFGAGVKSFSSLGAVFYQSATVTGGGEPSRVSAALASCRFLETLGVAPAIGRAFAPDECDFGKHRVAILTHGYWQRRYGGDGSAVGRSFTLDDEAYTVIGVLGPIPGETGLDMYVPLSFQPEIADVREARILTAIGRLRDGVTAEQAEGEIKSVAARIGEAHPESNAGWEAFLVPAARQAQGKAREPLAMLSIAVGLVLLITCANLANLLLVRAAGRHREVAIRAAMGASEGRVFRQMLTESLTLAVLGAAVGLVVAVWAVRLVIGWDPASLPRLREASLSGWVLLYAFLVSLAAGVVFGAAPAWQVLRLNVADTLRDETRGGTGGRGRSLARAVLVVCEVALSVILLTGAGLLLRTFAALSRIHMGFQPENVLTLRTTLPNPRYPSVEARASYVRRATERLESVPGVRAAGVTIALPMQQVNWNCQFQVTGKGGSSEERETATYNTATPHYFDAIGARLTRGRMFTDADNETAAKVVLISEAFAKLYFPAEDPLGRFVDIRVSKWDVHAQIVGVVGDIAHLRPEEPPRIAVYQPHAQLPWHYLAFAVRTAGAPEAMEAAVRRAFFEIDAELPVERVETLESLLGKVLAQQRLAMTLLVIFSGLAVVLAIVGLYGVLAVAVAQRQREIGIRMALGARPGDTVALVLKQGMGLTLAGVAGGLAAAPLATRMMEQMLYGVTPLDPVTFAGVALAVTSAALLATYIPARRAARVDPGVALRAE